MMRHFVLLAALAALAAPEAFAQPPTPAPSAQPAGFESFVPGLKGWKLAEAPGTYAKENLYELIDGEAEAYIGYGFQKARAALFEQETNGGMIEWRLFDMGETLNAFGIYQLYSQPAAAEMKVGAIGLVKGGYAAFMTGKYFVQIEGINGVEAEAKAAPELAQETAKLLPQDLALPEELSWFPPKGLVPGSIRYMPKGAFGYDFFKGGLEARYGVEGTKEELRALICRFGDNDASAKAFAAYQDFLRQRKVEPEAIFTGEQALRATDPYHGKVVVVRMGRWLAGAAGSADWPALESVARNILKSALSKKAKPAPERQTRPEGEA